MASLVLGGIGAYFFGPLGWLAGSLIGNLLFPGKQDGPRLSNLKLQGSNYGEMIPIPYGTIRIGGPSPAAPQVVWQTDLKEHEHKTGGKGGPEVTTFTYTASFAVKICKGPIAGILTIWAAGEAIWDVSGTYTNIDNGSVPVTVYLGVENANPDPTMEAELGVGNVPAFRDDAAVVFADWDLGKYGNTLPQLSFLVYTVGGQESPIFKLHEYHNNPPHEWCYSAVGGGGSDFGDQFPYITHWSLDNSDIRVRSYPSATTRIYANPSYVEAAADVIGDSVVAPVTSAGSNFGWKPIGTYVYADTSTTPLWCSGDFGGSGGGLIGASTTNCAVGSGSASLSGSTGLTGKNFANDAGVPAAEFFTHSALSQNGKILLVMTSLISQASRPTKWYRIVDGTVTSTGTIASNLNIIGLASQSLRNDSGTAGQASFNINVLEDNGEFLWCYSANNSYNPKVGEPNYSGQVGIATVFKIDPNTGILDWDSTGAAAFMTNPNETGIPYAAMCSPSDGYCGVIQGSSMALFSRIIGAGTILLSEIVSDVSTRVGLSAGDIDVSALTQVVDGYLISTRTDARSDLDQLRSAYFVDAVDSDGKAVFVNRGAAPVITIPDDELAAVEYGSEPGPLVEHARTQELELSAEVDIHYMNTGAAYQPGVQQAIRQVTLSTSVADLSLAIAMSDQKARQIANVLLYDTIAERDAFRFQTSRKYAYLRPTDVVAANGHIIRIENKRLTARGIVEFDGKRSIPALYTAEVASNATSGSGTPPSSGSSQPTLLVPLDIPLLVDTDPSIGIYAAMAGTADDTWKGANLYLSVDGGQTYTQDAALRTASVIGTAQTALGNFAGGNMFDELNSVSVLIGAGGGTLDNQNELAVLGGANMALLGSEIIQFKNAVLTAPLTYKLSGLLRGRRGTEFEMVTHVSGERFILLPSTVSAPLIFSDLGQSRSWKPVSIGSSLDSTQAISFVCNGVTLRPYSPTLLHGAPNAAGDILIQATRRTRVGGAWADFTDVPVSEPTELYVLQIWDSKFSTCARVVTGLTSPAFTYTNAMQVADFTRIQQTVYVSIAQLGTFGLGAQTNAAIPGAGSFVDAPAHPVQPFNTLPPPSPPTGGGCTGGGTVTNQNVTWGTGGGSFFSPSDFGPGDAWVFKFVIGASPGNYVLQFIAVEFGGPPTPRNYVLSLSPCGVPIQPTAHAEGNNEISVAAYTGFVPNPQTNPQLQPNTTYYITITTDGVSGMIANIGFKLKAS